MKAITKQQLIDTTDTERWKEAYGNSSFARNDCTECGNDVDITIEIGEEPDYESNTTWLCLECLQKAVKLALIVS
jgi:hypothetical protein